MRTDPGRPRRAAPLPSAAVPQAKPIGLVVNPLSGRDVRRLVAVIDDAPSYDIGTPSGFVAAQASYS